MWFGLLGRRLSHSFSPIIHAELGNYEYKLCEKEPDEIDDFLRGGDFTGLNVTIPYKKTVIPFCSELSDNARFVGSVNTIVRLENGSFYGDNTDTFGFRYLLEKTGIDPAARKTVVLGSGGSSLTVQAVLRDMGAREVAVISRSGPDNYDNIEKHKDAILLVNTTPVGMFPNNGLSPVADLSIFNRLRVVIDLIYNPIRTELLLQAGERGFIIADGLSMLVAQAAKSAELFTGASFDDNIIDKITDKIIRQTRNIMLIGMPGCGKTETGTELAKLMGRKFSDTDSIVEMTYGKPVPDIITGEGIEVFRKLETEALSDLCKQSGLVIATGGGIVTRPENLRIMRQNSVIVFLDRDISELVVSGRPLSKSIGVEKLAAERLPLYKQWSQYTVTVNGINETVSDILNLIE